MKYLIAIIVSLATLSAAADPAILKGANGVACQIPNSVFGPAAGQHDFTPADENDVVISTSVGLAGARATGLCRNVDQKVFGPFINAIAPALPLTVKYNSLNGGGQKTFCRMEDSDNVQYFTRKWRSLLKIEQVSATSVRITKLLLCVDGRAK